MYTENNDTKGFAEQGVVVVNFVYGRGVTDVKGATAGLAMTFGYIAALNAVREAGSVENGRGGNGVGAVGPWHSGSMLLRRSRTC